MDLIKRQVDVDEVSEILAGFSAASAHQAFESSSSYTRLLIRSPTLIEDSVIDCSQRS